MKKFVKKTLIISLILLAFTFFGAKVIAETEGTFEPYVASVGENVASYYVGDVIESQELDFGVKYHNDQGYTIVNDTSYVLGFVAGNESYGSERVQSGKEYSQNVNVLEIPCDSGVNIVPYANINVGKWTLTTVTAFINRYEEEHPDKKVIAAINGDYFDMKSEKNYPRTSTGGTVSEGNYYKVSSSWLHIGLKNDGSKTSLVGNITPTVSEMPYLEIFDENGNAIKKIMVNAINAEPGANETTVYFPFYNEGHGVIDTNVSDAYIVTGDKIAPFSKNSVYGLGKITKKGDQLLMANNFAIKTNDSEIDKLLENGVTVRCQYEYTGELADVDNVIGYPNNLIVDGNPNMNGEYRHPRTMIGIKEDGTIIMTTVDGRQVSKGCYGVCIVEQAALMKYYGCINAFNLDGGGSTTMVIKEDGEFKIKNLYSDGSPRSDGNCLLITVDVPVMDLNFLSTEDSVTFNVDIIKKIDKFSDLYVSMNNEMKHVVDGTVTFDNLDVHSDYVYKFYALDGDKYLGLPYTGKVKTSKIGFSLNSVSLEEGLDKNGNDVFIFSVDVTDEYDTIVTIVININEKRYMMNNNQIVVPKDKGIASSYTSLVITYDNDDYRNRQELELKDFDYNTNALLSIESICDNIKTWFEEVLN